MLLVLLLGVVDFGRVFSAGIVMEASARNGAEVGALERLRDRPSSGPLDAYYADLHLQAVETACEDSRRLPTFGGSDNCPAGAHDRNGATAWFARACVHDGIDPRCGQPADGYADPLPAQCTDANRAWSTNFTNAASYFVEVRVCYKFETLFNLDLSLPMGAGISVGDVWLQRTRTFVVDCQVGPNPDTVCPQ